MTFRCPECQARIRRTTPGSVVACPSCASPVVVPEAAAEPRPAAAPAPVPTTEAGWTTQRLWGTAAAVVAVLAVAHVALFLLLTMDARSGIREIEAAYRPDELEAAKRPGGAPEPGTPAYATWSRGVDLWEKAEAWRVHGRQVMLLRTGLVISFLILVGITGWGVNNLLRRRPRTREGSRRPARS